MKFISSGFAVWQFSVASALQSTVLCSSRRPLEREPPKNWYRDTLFSFADNCFNHYRALYSEGSFTCLWLSKRSMNIITMQIPILSK